MKEKQYNSYDHFGKIPPQDNEIEKSLLGAFIIADNDTRNSIIKIITYESFYNPSNAIIFEVLINMYDNNEAIDLLTLSYKLRQQGKLDEIGGEVYLVDLTERVVTHHHAPNHATIIQELYITREIISLTIEIQRLAFQKTVGLDHLIGTFERKIKELVEKAEKSLPNEKKNLVNDVLMSIGKMITNGSNNAIYRTGDSVYDNIINCMVGEIIFLAGPPKSAKTKSLIVYMHLLIQKYKDELNILWYCMEDPSDKIIRNRLSIETGIADEKIMGLEGHLTTEEYNSLKEAGKVIENSAFLDYKDYPETIDNIYRNYKSFVKKDKMNILIIDNFNMCTDLEYSIKNQTDREIKVASKIQSLGAHLKHMGYNSCIFVVDHLKKEIELGLEYGFRPSTKDLKGSERKYAILTQLILINRPGKNRQLIDEERDSPPIEINGKKIKRTDLLDHLIILERTEARNGKDTGKSIISRIYSEISTMQFKNLKLL